MPSWGFSRCRVAIEVSKVERKTSRRISATQDILDGYETPALSPRGAISEMPQTDRSLYFLSHFTFEGVPPNLWQVGVRLARAQEVSVGSCLHHSSIMSTCFRDHTLMCRGIQVGTRILHRKAGRDGIVYITPPARMTIIAFSYCSMLAVTLMFSTKTERLHCFGRSILEFLSFL